MHVPRSVVSHFPEEVSRLSPLTRLALADADRVLHALKSPDFRLHGANETMIDEASLDEVVRFALRSLGVDVIDAVMVPIHLSVTRVSNPVWATKASMRNVAGAMLRGSLHQMMVDLLEAQYEESLLSVLGFDARKKVTGTILKNLPDRTPYGSWKDAYIIALSKMVLPRYLMLAATDDPRVEEMRPLVTMLPHICLIGRMKGEEGMPTRWIYAVH